MKKYKFALTDNTTYYGKDALEFYSKALLEGVSKATFRVIPGVKSTVKVPRYDAGNIIQDAGCTWTPSGEGTLGQKTMEVCSKDIQLELCATTFENNFLGELLRPGHNSGEVSPAEFTDYMVDQIGKKVQNDLEIAVWQGDSESMTYPMNICDGLETLFAADGTVIKVEGTVASNNVIAEISKVYDKIPTTIINSPDLKLYVSDHIYRLYVQAVAAQSNEAYYVGEKEANFLGVEMVRATGMAANTMVAAESTNLILLTDLLSDEEELNLIPQGQITGTRTIRIAGGFKFGVNYLVSDEIVYYTTAVIS